jgi:ankyrin repeat protein
MKNLKKFSPLLLFCLIFAGGAFAADDPEDFFKKIEDNDVAGIKTAIKNGFEINEVYTWGRHSNETPLMYAVRKIKPDIVEALLDSGADANFYNAKSGSTPLLLAVMIDAVRAEDATIFIDKNDSAKTVEVLLRSGADINADWGGGTALAMAVAGTDLKRSLELTKMLIAEGADVNKKTEPESHLIILALTSLLGKDGFDQSEKEKHGASLLKILLEAGADPNEQMLAEEVTPLHFAVMAGNYSAVKILLEAGADPNIKDNSGTTPAEMAFKSLKFRIWSLLKGYGTS